MNPSPSLWRHGPKWSRESDKWTPIAALIVVFAITLSSASLHADEPSRVVMVAPDGALERAVALALEPWHLTVQSVPEANPGATMPDSSQRGRAIAEGHNALAVVWVSESGGGYALWLFDRRLDRVVARPLPGGPPFDAPTAAEVALIVKTLLRTVPNAVPPEQTEAPVQTETPVAGTLMAPGEAETSVRETPRSSSHPGDGMRWSVLLAGGARARATIPATPEARFLLGATIWPRRLGQWLGVTLLVESGPGMRLDTSTLRSRWTESSAMLGLRGRLRLSSIIDIGATLGFGLRFTTLTGDAERGANRVQERRFDPTSRVELEIGASTGRLRIELRAGAALPFRVQRYFVGEALALTVTPASIQATLGIEVRIR